MYEELVTLLRKKYDKAPLVIAAADALEHLQKKNSEYLSAYISEHDANTYYLNAYIAEHDSRIEEIKKHKWIPVNFRYPDIMDSVIISGRMKYKWETQFTYFVDVAMYTGDKDFGTFNDWYEGQDEFEITHWMPLPEPIED